MRSNIESRYKFLIESFKDARRELIFRVRNRDQWLKFALVGQATLFALGAGVKLPWASTASPVTDFLFLIAPVNGACAFMYVVEDRLIGLLGRFAARASKAEIRLCAETVQLDTWDDSPELREYAGFGLTVRFLAQLTTFSVSPLILFTLGFIKTSYSGKPLIFVAIVGYSMLLLSSTAIVWSYIFRLLTTLRVTRANRL